MRRGLTLLEILVAAVILVLIVTTAGATFVSIKRLSQRIYYRYTALNLAKDVLEFGEAAIPPEAFTLTYSYSSSYHAYRLTAYTNFDPDTQQHPFSHGRLGDIKAKGLVPKGAADSVVIFYNVSADPEFYDALMHTVKVTWREKPSDPERKVVLKVLPIRQVNDQLQLDVAEFWWD